MEAFMQVSRVSPTPPSASGKLAVRDLKLPGFAGSKLDSADYIEPDFYLPLLMWSREVRTVLAANGLSNRQHAFSIINASNGAARRSFFHAYESNFGTPDFDTKTPVDSLNKLVALVPDHKAMFAQKALGMSFALNVMIMIVYGHVR